MIIAVVVTYNRLEHLKRLLQGLRRQTIVPDKIIVVNNSSTDGTGEWLASNNDLLVITQENSGGSGGFHTGVKAAFELHADWIWIMDDDVIPRQDCLQLLLEHKTFSQCLNPVRVSHAGKIEDEERWFDAESCQIISCKNRSYKNGKKFWFRNIGTFEGMLIAREIVEKIGFPDKRFFISHDDLLYGYLANKFTNVSVIADAVFDRQYVNKAAESAYNYEYYRYRNLWIIEEYLNKEDNSLKGYRHRRIIWQFLYAIYKVFRLNEFKSRQKAIKIYWKAFRDYKKKKQGKMSI